MLSQLILTGLMVGAVYGLVALGFVMIYKSSRIFNFAQGQLVMIGAYLSYVAIEEWGLPIWLGFVVTLILMAAMGMIVERLFIRPMIGQPIFSVIMITILLSGLLSGSAMLAWGGGGSSQPYPVHISGKPIEVWDAIIAREMVLIFIAAIALMIVFYALFRFTKVGLRMRVVAEDHQVAQALGISVKRVFVQAWVISTVIAAIGGILISINMGLVTFDMAHIGLIALPVVLLGGLESLTGAVLAGLLVGVLENVVSYYVDPYVPGGNFREIAPFVIMMVVLLVRPYGLFGQKTVERV